MRIELKKFGNILTSRPAGKDAWSSAQAYILSDLNSVENIEVDFSGLAVLSPSWADEFLTPLKSKYTDRVKFLPSDNPTVKATLEIIEKQRQE
ncbi:MAG TPA: DUF4325 domain-containing protein [Patescibacteria group bacterium]|nr:DUF4325 domain-containing protein [Patescibacteria group bacterium]